ncbi:MAG TPA: gamma-glutamyltransferase family protein [Candidatus Limnocylindria bacterium]|nr:gamma-glutamyltransferase family protein [Candidatus Limnocylindria bacterium]
MLSRQPVYAPNGVVATSQPLATQVGLDMLRRGGNAVDAAVAMGIAATVVEPTTSSIGGDAFALVWDGRRLHGLNGSGRSPAGLSAAVFERAGLTAVPSKGWLSVTVPGAPAAWRDLHARFGRLPFERLCAPAIEYAERGFPVSPMLARGWARLVEEVHAGLRGPEYTGFGGVFAPEGRAPRVGERWASKEMARTLRLIAASGGEEFYLGEIARRIVDFAQASGGFISAHDLATHSSTWVEPISSSYRGYEVWEIPPNGQGLAALIALNILEGYDIGGLPRGSTELLHLQIEAMKLAFADTFRYIADPSVEAVPTAELLSKDYAAGRRALIGQRAALPSAGVPAGSNTIYLCTADRDGMMVSYIQSTYEGCGSHVVVPGTGIALQNRGACFVLEPGHPNRVAPAKRPFHTIIPGFLTRDQQPVGPFGVMGGHMQPQGHLQVMVNTIDHGLDPQAALEAPRWHWARGREVLCEPAVGEEALAGLAARGHAVEVWSEAGVFGRGQIIWRLPSGGYVAGSEPRADGQAAGY